MKIKEIIKQDENLIKRASNTLLNVVDMLDDLEEDFRTLGIEYRDIEQGITNDLLHLADIEDLDVAYLTLGKLNERLQHYKAETKNEISLAEFTNMIDVVGPQYRGAPYPPFKSIAINVSRIPDTMRPKYWEIDSDTINEEQGTFEFEYITQEPFTSEEAEEFINEMKRAIKALIKDSNYNEPFTILLDVYPRDGKEYGHIVLDLDFNK